MADGPQEPQIKVLDYRELGQTGLRRFSGFIFEEFLLELTGWRGMAVYKEMAWNDPVVSAMLFAITSLIRRVSWRVEAASEHPNDEEAAEFLETCQNDMSETWIDTITQILSMLTYGYSLHEIVYKRRLGDVVDPSKKSKYTDGRIGWRKIPVRSQDTIYRWLFDDHGGIQGAQQMAPPHYYLTTLPMEKCLLFRATIAKNDPEGKSALRGAYRPWYMKKNIENIEAIGIERDLAGLPCALVPPEILSAGASADQKNLLSAIQNIVVNIRRDAQEGVIFPMVYDQNGKPMYELKLLSTGGQRQFDTDKIIQRYDQRIAMTMLSDFVLLGHDKVGSFALANSKTNVFATAMGAVLDMVAEIFNRDAIPRLFDLNDFQISDYPKIVHGDLESVDLNELGNYVKNLAGAGYPLFPNVDLEKYLMKVANLPEPADEVAKPSLQVENPNQGGGKKRKVVEIPAEPVQDSGLGMGLSYESNPSPAQQPYHQEVAEGERLRGTRR